MPIEIIVIPSVVQGREAPTSLRRSLLIADAMNDIDAIIIGRGGGSIEDLWAFNDEALARAIFQCNTPVISAVGHEIDFSIADFVADLRAPTPSAAAEIVSFDHAAMIQTLQTYARRLQLSIQKHITQRKNDAKNLSRRLKHPGDRIQQWQQRTDFCEARLHEAMGKKLSNLRQRMQLVGKDLALQTPDTSISAALSRLGHLRDRLQHSTKNLIDKKRLSFAKTSNALHIVSPLATLERGYTISRTEDGTILRSVKQLDIGQTVKLAFRDGEAKADITHIPTDTSS